MTFAGSVFFFVPTKKLLQYTARYIKITGIMLRKIGRVPPCESGPEISAGRIFKKGH